MIKKRKNLGFGFPDEVAKITAKIGHFKKGDSPDWTDLLLPNFRSNDESLIYYRDTWRIIFFAIVSLIFFFIIFIRLFNLQIVHGEENKLLADGNRIQVKVIHAPRGVIFDRNGKILAANSPAFRFIDKDPNGKSKLITREQALEWEVKNDSRFFSLEVDNVRTYLMGEKLAHVLGFVGEISEKQLKSSEFKNYRAGDQVGQFGIEAEYEKRLKGIDGGEIIEIDSKGRKLRTLRTKNPIPGQNIYLSIDGSLQERIYEKMQEALKKSESCCGAAVAADPETGKILALLSLPSFDPNLFTKGGDDSAIEEIFSRSSAPLLNRVIGGTYPPGSTFKIVSSLAALDSGKVSEQSSFQDNGVIFLGPYKFSNWYFNQYGKTEGPVNLKKALQRSNDIYFYEISRIIGEGSIIDWSRKLFLGKNLGIDLPGEETGLVPDNEWKQKAVKQPWYPGDTLHMSIGQGFLLTTPLQVLGITSFIAADGNLYKPNLILDEKPKLLVSNLASKDKINIIKQALELVPKEGGTAWPFFTFPIATAGKTGTAEFGDPKERTHAWYTAYAPAKDPKIALTVLIEGGGEGSTVASPVAKEVFRWYLSPDKNKLIQDINVVATESAKTLGE